MPSPPPTMHAVAITTPGGPEVLKMVEQPTPRPGPGQVLVKVAAAGVNRPDVAQRAGSYPPPPGHSPLPGLEIAGSHESVPSAATGIAMNRFAACGVHVGRGKPAAAVALR